MLRWPEARGGCGQSVGTDPTGGPTSLILFFISSPGNLRELNVWIRAFMGQGYISFHWGGVQRPSGQPFGTKGLLTSASHCAV